MRASKTSRLLLAAAHVITAVAVAAPLAAADAVYHSKHIALHPIGGAPLRSGFVENIHADGPQVYAHELYGLNGAEPDTTYQVTLLLYPFDPSCVSDAVPIPTASFQTNPGGDGIGHLPAGRCPHGTQRRNARHPLGGHERKLHLQQRLLDRNA